MQFIPYFTLSEKMWDKPFVVVATAMPHYPFDNAFRAALPDKLSPIFTIGSGQIAGEFGISLRSGRAHAAPIRQNWENWSGRQDSNLRPSGPKPDALPGCATPRHLQVLRFPAVWRQAESIDFGASWRGLVSKGLEALK